MHRRWLLLLATALCAGCGGAAGTHEPLDFEAPWQEGDRAEYTVLAGGARVEGNHTLGVEEAEGGGWVLFESAVRPTRSHEAWVTVDEELRPVRTKMVGAGSLEGKHAESEWGEKQIEFTGSDGEKAIERQVDAIDNQALYTLIRAMPLAEGYERDLTIVNTVIQVDVPLSVKVEGSEEVTVPAGTFEAWKVEISLTGGPIEAWFAKAPPHWMVKRVRVPTKSTYVLRAYRPSKEAEWVGDPEPVERPEPGPVRVKWAMLLVQLFVQFPVMCALPLILGFVLWRRHGATLNWFAIGIAGFIASQVVHLPLNWALGLIGQPRAVALLPTLWVGIIAGLSAGLCEELARYVAMRWVLKRDRSWLNGVQYGMGHGGVESIILGGLVAMTLLNVLLAPFSPWLGVPPEAQQVMMDAARQYWASTEPWQALVAAYERICAICAHIGMSVLVMRAVTRRNVLYLILAILLHTALDAPIVYAAELGHVGLYAFLTVFALTMVAMTIALKEPAPAEPPASSSGDPLDADASKA